MAVGDLTSLDNVKAWLGLNDPDQTGDDAVLARLITAVSGFIKSWCNRDFTQQPYIETRDGTGGVRMPLRNTPIITIDSLLIDGHVIPPGDAVTTPGYYFTATMLGLNGYIFPRRFGNVVVHYTAGLAVIPPELEQACIELLAFRFKELPHIGMASKAMAGETTSFVIKDMPSSVATILNQYKRVVPL